MEAAAGYPVPASCYPVPARLGLGFGSSSVAMSVAGFPTWVMLEPFIFRRDGDESFPDETKTPIRSSATTSWGADFRVAFFLAEPPHISRLYAQLPVPGFLDRWKADPLAILATHRHLILLRVGTILPTGLQVQDFFIYNAEESSLKALPPCTEPNFDYTTYGDGHAASDDSDDPDERDYDDYPADERDYDDDPADERDYDDDPADERDYDDDPADPGRLLEVKSMGYYDDDPADAARLLEVKSMGLWCGDREFVVAELTTFIPISRSNAFVNICMLRTCTLPLDRHGATWKSICVDIQCSYSDDILQLRSWATNTVIPFHQWLCCIDYNRGILFCDMSKEPTPPSSFLRFPLHDFPSIHCHKSSYSFLYRSVSVVDQALKFVNVTRHDGIAWGTLKPGTSFTITCHTLVLGGDRMEWKEDYKVTSSELWDANLPDRLPRCILLFPQVDIDMPHVVHFLLSEYEYANKKMWMVSIDMSTKTVKSCSLYINGNEGLQTDDADLIRDKSLGPLPFIPCEFPKYLYSPRKSKEIH